MLLVKATSAKHKAKCEKNKVALKLEDCTLYFNKGVVKKTVSAKVLLQTFQSDSKHNEEFNEAATTVTDKMEEITNSGEVIERDFAVYDGSKILEEFTVITHAVDNLEVKEGSLFIREDYLPDDDDAPQRICDMVNEYVFLWNQLFEQKSQIVDEFRDFVTSQVQSYCMKYEGESRKPVLKRIIRNKDKSATLVDETALTLPMNKVKETLFITQVSMDEHNKKMMRRLANNFVVGGEGYLEGLELRMTTKDGVIPVNLESFSLEVQTLLGEIRNHFSMVQPA